MNATLPGGTWTSGDLTVTRFGYGAMQLAGPWVMGPPADRDGAVAVLREAVELGITHVDTSLAYGPRVTNELIREALHPYPSSLHVVTKVGAERDAEGGGRRPGAPQTSARRWRRTSGRSGSRCSTWSTCAWATPGARSRARSPRRSGRWSSCGRRA